MLAVTVDGRISGNCYLERQPARKDHAGLLGIVLAENVRNQGIGTVCLDILVGQAEAMGLKLLYLTVFADNERAIHVYEKKGFVYAGVIPGAIRYKGKYIGEVFMYKNLKGS